MCGTSVSKALLGRQLHARFVLRWRCDGRTLVSRDLAPMHVAGPPPFVLEYWRYTTSATAEGTRNKKPISSLQSPLASRTLDQSSITYIASLHIASTALRDGHSLSLSLFTGSPSALAGKQTMQRDGCVFRQRARDASNLEARPPSPQPCRSSISPAWVGEQTRVPPTCT